MSEGIVKLKHTLVGHEKFVSLVCWSPNDEMILTCGHEEVVKLWDVESGECKQTFDKPTKDFTACSWFPDGKRFISGGGDECIHIWDITGRKLEILKGKREHRIQDMCMTSDGTRIISISNRQIRIYNLETKSEKIIMEEKPVTSFSISGDGKLLLVNIINQGINLWNIERKELLSKYVGHRQTRYVIRSCFGGVNQDFIASGSEDSQVSSNLMLFEIHEALIITGVKSSNIPVSFSVPNNTLCFRSFANT
jgi:WD40 repeat protein